MKKLVLYMVAILMLIGCSQSETSIHEDLVIDMDQIFEITDLAYEQNRRLNEEEMLLFDKFENKYLLGKFQSDDEWYEMNKLERIIVREFRILSAFTEHEESLTSETSSYEHTKEVIEGIIESGEVSPEKDKDYPTYERQEDVHPKFIDDTVELINLIEPLISDGVLETSHEVAIQEYMDKYGGDGFKVDNTNFLHNEKS